MEKVLLAFILLISTTASCFAQEDFSKKFDILLKEHAEGGLVKYSDIKNDQIVELSALLDKFDIKSTKDDKYKAFLINAYNFLVIKSIKGNYPLNNATGLPGMYDQIEHKIGSKKLTLDAIENDFLRKHWSDPRIHFALVCGALGCPPITSFSYKSDKLVNQLDNQAKSALNDNQFVRVDDKSKVVFLSEIFKWFKDDFTKKYKTEIEYINSYRKNKIPTDYKIMYYPYDWTVNDYSNFHDDPNGIDLVITKSNLSNVQAYTPSKLLKKGQFDAQLFNNLYTQNAYFNEKGERTDTDTRSNYYGTQFTFNYGVAKSRWLNVGMDANFKAFSTDTSTSSPFDVLKFSNDSTQSRATLSTIGPKIKISPFKKLSISIQSTLLIPIGNDLEGDEYDLVTGEKFRPWLDWNRLTLWNQFFYDQSLGAKKKFQIFMEADLLFRFKRDSTKYFMDQPKTSHLNTPVSFFLSYFPSKLSTIYTFVQHSPTWMTDKLPYNGAEQTYLYVSSHFSQTGLGFKYQLTNHLAIELLYTKFFAGKHWGGAGETYNLGIRYLK